MDPAISPPATSSATGPGAPPSLPTDTSNTTSGRPDSAHSSRSHQEYIDSLVVPSKEEFAHIAQVQAEREAEQKRLQREKRQSLEPAAAAPAQPSHASSLAARFGFGSRTNVSEDGIRAKAATIIQRNYRGYRVRREIKGLGIDASTRWLHAVREAQWRALTTPRARPTFSPSGTVSPGRPDTAASAAPSFLGSRASTARTNWKKASTIARHAGNDVDADDSSSSSSSSSDSSSDSDADDHQKSEKKKLARKRKEEDKARRKQESKMMGLQYFLEMVDLKHRYGANLRVYHEEWKRAETNENFFYWLDHGEGKNVDIEAMPREILDREQVRYLSREERQYYLVKVDDQGRLCWAKNGARIDTSQKWKDSIHGIVPSDDATPAYAPVSDRQTALLGDTDSGRSSSDSSDSISSAHAARYQDPSDNTSTKKISHHLSGATIFNKLLRKTVRKNTWIFVADTSFRLYVGIKNSGAFQHSSFLQGSRISAAGLIRIRDGRLSNLSPLSGHYRPPAANFRAFVKSLKEAGVDMGRVSVSKSYAVLVGLEAYMKVKKKAGDVVGKVTRRGRKGGELVVPDPDPAAKERAIAEEDEEQAAEGENLKEEEKAREENEIAVEAIQRLGLEEGATEPKGQKGGGDAEEGAVHP